jgi:hypothetical protein
VSPEQQQLVIDLLWSDPAALDSMDQVVYNHTRKISYCFGPTRVREFCDANQISHIVRAHECCQDGVDLASGGRLITVFSAVNYCGKYQNAGSILEVTVDEEGQIRISTRLLRHSEDWTLSQPDPNARPPSPMRGQQGGRT